MFIALGLFAIGTGIGIVVMRSRKSLSHILYEVKFEVYFNLVGLLGIIEDFLTRGYNKADVSLKTGKVALITGGNRGIGLQVFKMLLQCDVHVIVGCRNVAAMEQALETFRKEGMETGTMQVYKLDTSSIKSVKEFARRVKEEYNKIHYLINNAGMLFYPYTESVDGYEAHFATNYLGHFLLTHLLLPEVIAGGEEGCNARIVNISSCMHALGNIDFEDINCRKHYVCSAAYSNSKLAQVLFTVRLNDILKEKMVPVQVHAVHPGMVNTEILSSTYAKRLAPFIPNLFFKTPERGAIPIIYACFSADLGQGGTYISNSRVVHASGKSNSIELQERLFIFTNRLLGIEEFGKDKQL